MAEKENKNIYKTFFSAGLVLLLLIVLLAVFFVLTLINFQTARGLGIFRLHQLSFHSRPRQLTAADANSIDTWMTFHYINIAFRLPDSYLRGQLNITDQQYPNLTLGKYIATNHLNKTLFIGEIKKVVSDFLSGNPVK